MGRESRRNKALGIKVLDNKALAKMRASPGQHVVTDNARPYASMLRSAALHEAGHAVAAIVLKKHRVEFVILRAGITASHCHVGGYCETAFASRAGSTIEEAIAAYRTPEILRIRAIQALAGPAAEFIGTESKYRADVDKGAITDDQEATNLVVQIVGSNYPAFAEYYESCHDEAHTLIREHWPAVCAIAQYLLSHQNEQMPGSMVEQYIAEHDAAVPVD